jgi:hypothetical protein
VSVLEPGFKLTESLRPKLNGLKTVPVLSPKVMPTLHVVETMSSTVYR